MVFFQSSGPVIWPKRSCLNFKESVCDSTRRREVASGVNFWSELAALSSAVNGRKFGWKSQTRRNMRCCCRYNNFGRCLLSRRFSWSAERQRPPQMPRSNFFLQQEKRKSAIPSETSCGTILTHLCTDICKYFTPVNTHILIYFSSINVTLFPTDIF